MLLDVTEQLEVAHQIQDEIKSTFNVDCEVEHIQNWGHNVDEIFIMISDRSVFESKQYQDFIAFKTNMLLTDHIEVSWYFTCSPIVEI